MDAQEAPRTSCENGSGVRCSKSRMAGRLLRHRGRQPRVGGFCEGTPHDGAVPGYAGELNKIYLLRCVQRQGLGRLLLCAVARRFLDSGVTSMLLFGDAANPSNGFYEAFGAVRL